MHHSKNICILSNFRPLSVLNIRIQKKNNFYKKYFLLIVILIIKLIFWLSHLCGFTHKYIKEENKAVPQQIISDTNEYYLANDRFESFMSETVETIIDFSQKQNTYIEYTALYLYFKNGIIKTILQNLY